MDQFWAGVAIVGAGPPCGLVKPPTTGEKRYPLDRRGRNLHWRKLTDELDESGLRRYAEICGVSLSDALLVRPDPHVAPRCQGDVGDGPAWRSGALDACCPQLAGDPGFDASQC